jgi:predicted aspartyl protease
MRRLVPLALLAGLVGLTGCSAETVTPTAAQAAPPASAAPSPAANRIPLDVRKGERGKVALQVQVTLPDGKAYPFAVDTGAQTSSIEAPLATALALPVKGDFLLHGVTGTEKTQIVGLQGWTLGAVALPPMDVVVTQLPPDVDPQEPRIAGLLGSDVLSTFGRVVVDYRGGFLELGP